MLPIPSNWTNVINTIVFEFVLLTLVFYLTADVCARLNYLALVDGSIQDLVVVSPPLVGGGLISTSRKRSMFMIVLRGLGVVLIFGSALTIDGESRTEKVYTRKLVRTAADVPFNTTKNQIVEFIEMRMSCTTTENNSLVFGRLDFDGYCETDVLLLESAIRIRNETIMPNISLSSDRCYNETVSRAVLRRNKILHMTFTCKEGIQKAYFHCYGITCQGLFKLSESKWTFCGGIKNLLHSPQISVNTRCRGAENLGEIQDRWFDATDVFFIRTRSSPSQLASPLGNFPIAETIYIISLMGIESRNVPSFKTYDATNIQRMWFLCLTVKLLLVVSLALSSIWLRVKRAKAVLKDDRALVELLHQTLDDSFGAQTGDQRNTIYLHLNTSEEGTRNIWASSVPNYHPGNFNPGNET